MSIRGVRGLFSMSIRGGRGVFSMSVRRGRGMTDSIIGKSVFHLTEAVWRYRVRVESCRVKCDTCSLLSDIDGCLSFCGVAVMCIGCWNWNVHGNLEKLV